MPQKFVISRHAWNFPPLFSPQKGFQKVTLIPKRFYQHWFFSPKKHQRILFFGSQLFSSSPALRSQVEKPPFFFSSFSRWWQLKYFWNFHPEPWGRWTQFDECFWDGLKPPTSFVFFFSPQDVKALHEALGNTDDALAASLVPWTRVGEFSDGWRKRGGNDQAPSDITWKRTWK